jgi:hypothetical protein
VGGLVFCEEKEGKRAILFVVEISWESGNPLKMKEFWASQTPQITKRGRAFKCL